MMKKSIKILALALSLVMVLGLLVACGGKKLSGTYELDATVGESVKTGAVTTLTFSGSKITQTLKTYVAGSVTSTDVFEGTYKITEQEDGSYEITITYTVQNDADLEKAMESTVVFSEDEETGDIKLGPVTYKKK